MHVPSKYEVCCRQFKNKKVVAYIKRVFEAAFLFKVEKPRIILKLLLQ
jgi:hypothetical protein